MKIGRYIATTRPRHLVERTRFLADRDHLDDHVGEQLRVLHGLLQALTRGDLVTHVQYGQLEDDIAGCAGNGFHRLDQRHAGREHRGQRPRVARDGRLRQDRPDNRNFEHQAIQEVAECPRALLEINECADSAAYDQREDHTLGAYEGREVYHHARERRQVGAEALEQVLE